MKTFYVGIKGVIVKDDKVLLLHASDDKDFWENPGGRIEGSENIEQALIRELQEELPNIKEVVIHEILNAYRVPRDVEDEKSLVLVFYRVSAEFDGDPQISHEHTEWKWVAKEEALGLVHESCQKAVQAAFA